MDTKLNWKQHIDIKIIQTKNKLHQLKTLINRKNYLPYKTAITLFKTIIRPTLLYACPVWINAAKTNINKIQIVQNQFLRTITNAPWFISNHQLHNEFNLDPIMHHITYLSHNFFSNTHHIQTLSSFNLCKNPIHPTRIKNKYPFHIFCKLFSDLE